MSEAIKERNPQDRVISPDDPIREPGPEQRHEIIRELEGVNDTCGGIGTFSQPTLRNFAADIASENTGHAIIAEPFASFVADDVFDLFRPTVGRLLFSRGLARDLPFLSCACFRRDSNCVRLVLVLM